MNLLILFLSILPIYLIGLYYYKKDTITEPKSLLKKLFFSGVLAGIVVVVISLISFIFFPRLMNSDELNSFELLVYCFIFVAFVEEVTKWFMIYKISYDQEYFDQYFDIILYSVFVGLGFACFENIIYVSTSSQALQTALLRSITAIPGHACFQTIMGYFLGNCKFNLNGTFKKNLTLSIVVPTILHGIYDYLLLSNNLLFLLIYFIFIIILFVVTVKKIKQSIKYDKERINSNICPRCNTYIKFNYCPTCGYKKTSSE